MNSDIRKELRGDYHTQISATRTASMRALSKASACDNISPKQMQWPVAGSPNGKNEHLNAHTAVLRYRAELRPYRDEHEELWAETTTTVDPPLDDLAAGVSPANAGEWERVFAKHRRKTTSTVRGTETHTRQFRVLLPVTALQALYDRLNDLLKAIEFAPPAESTTESTVGGIDDDWQNKKQE